MQSRLVGETKEEYAASAREAGRQLTWPSHWKLDGVRARHNLGEAAAVTIDHPQRYGAICAIAQKGQAPRRGVT